MLGRRAALIAWFGLVAMSRGAADEVGVREAFEGYRAALIARDGAAAASMVTAGSSAYYERLRDLALRAPSALVGGLPLPDRLAVLRLRHEFSAAELAPLSGGELIAISVEESWSSARTLRGLQVLGAETDGATATLMVAAPAADTPAVYHFRREAGRWLLDLAKLAHDSGPALAASLAVLAHRAGVDERRAVVLAVEASSGHLVDRDLWLPMTTAP